MRVNYYCSLLADYRVACLSTRALTALGRRWLACREPLPPPPLTTRGATNLLLFCSLGRYNLIKKTISISLRKLNSSV